MSNIISLPRRDVDRVVWRCGCGCLTSFVRADDELECAQCGSLARGNTGEWRKHLPPVPAVVAETVDGDVKVTDLNSVEAALKRVARTADPDKVFALIVVNRDGSLSVWGGNLETDKQRAWFDRKLAETKALLVKG